MKRDPGNRRRGPAPERALGTVQVTLRLAVVDGKRVPWKVELEGQASPGELSGDTSRSAPSWPNSRRASRRGPPS